MPTMAPTQDELKAELKELMQKPENLVCLDCNDKRPMWASLIVPPPGAPFSTIGCFCCYQCSGAHRRMGTHICFVRSTNLDECKSARVFKFLDGCASIWMEYLNVSALTLSYFGIFVHKFREGKGVTCDEARRKQIN